MEKLVNIDNIKVCFKNTANFLLNYKEQFGKDALKDIFDLKSNTSLNSDLYYNLIWALAKTARYDIEPSEEWLSRFDKLSLIKIVPEVMDMILISLSSSIVERESSGGCEISPTTELILVSAIKRGLCLHDFERMTIGMILDYIYAYDDKEDERTIEATQMDFDKF